MSKEDLLARGPESLVERRILEAQREGRFDDLVGSGRPLADIDEPYDPLWWCRKLLLRESISVLPPALELRRRVERDLEAIWRLRREDDVRSAVDDLNQEIRRVNASVVDGPSTDIGPIDVEEALSRWRDAAGSRQRADESSRSDPRILP